MKFIRLLLILPLLVYLALPTRNYYWDGIAYADMAEKQYPLRLTLHPNHLLYTPACTWLYHTALLLGIKTRALFLMQGANSVLAAACVVLLYRALRRRDFSRESAAGAALVFAFAATWWRFATDANAYIPSIFVLLCANDLLESRRSTSASGLLHAFAMLFHQLALFFLPVALFRLRRQPKQALRYFAACVVPLGLGYLLAYRAVFGELDGAKLLRWTVFHSPDSAFAFQPVRDLLFTLRGTLRLFFGGRFGEVVPSALTVSGVAVLLLAIGIFIYRWWRSGPQLPSVPSMDLLIWVSLYVAFLFFWMPQNTFYRLFYLAPLILLVATTGRSARPDRFLPLLLGLVVFAWNLLFLIYPQSRIENNAPLHFALTQKNRWPAGTMIANHEYPSDLWTISYFNPQATWMWLDKLDLYRLDQASKAASARSQHLWLDESAYRFVAADPGGRRWLDSHQPSLFMGGDPKHSFRFYELH